MTTARLGWLLLLLAALSGTAGAQGVLRGRVSSADLRPLAGAVLELGGTRLGATTGAAGRYEIRAVPPGRYVVRVRSIGFRAENREVALWGSETLEADFALQILPASLADIVVTPSRTAIAQDRAISSATLSTEDIAVLPQLGEDLYRAITRLPGMASYDYSAKFWVRGGPEREVLARFDGVDLIEPYHLKDFDAALSIVDAATIGRLELTSGGFTAEYGDRLTGVLGMETLRAPPKGSRHSLGLSITSARVSSLGSFARGKGQWLVAARRGYLDVALKLIGNDQKLSPRYYDISARTEYQLGAKHNLSLHLLRAADAVNFSDDFERVLTSHYGNTYVWTGWRARFGRALTAATVVSFTRLSWNREGDARSVPDPFRIVDVRSASGAGIRQDWTLGVSEKLLFKWGADLKAMKGSYDYNREQGNGELQTTLQLDGRSLGVYFATRVRPWTALTVEAGARFDRNSLADESRLSPRFNAALDLGRGTALRAAWGSYAQAPGIHEVQVQDGEDSFRPAELATQRGIGLEKIFSSGIAMKLEAYDRRYTRLNPLWVNLSNQSEVFPEAEFDRRFVDRIRGRARGMELLVQRREGRRFDWAASYAYAIAEDEITEDFPTNRVTVPRARDQRHTVYLDFTYAPSAKWRLSGAWQFHSGWPYTERSTGEFSGFGTMNAARLPAYHRLDARVTRQIPLRGSALRVFVDVFNLYDRGNPRGYTYVFENQGGQIVRRLIPDNQLPFLPSFGISFDF